MLRWNSSQLPADHRFVLRPEFRTCNRLYEPYSDIDVSTKVEDLEETEPEDAVTKRNDGLMHTNVVMKDTTENRVDVSRQLLNEDSSEDS